MILLKNKQTNTICNPPLKYQSNLSFFSRVTTLPRLIKWEKAMGKRSGAKKRTACWEELKDLVECVDSVVAHDRVLAVLTVCIYDLNERFTKVEAQLN